MASVDSGRRELLISTERSPTNGVIVAVRDSGPGIDPENLERIFEAFYTTKSSGVGMGFRSAVPSSRPMAAGCGPMRMNLAGRYFNSHCLSRKV
jgi:hypothetical protein